MCWTRFQKGLLSLLRLLQTGNIDTMLSTLQEYSLDHLKTPGVIKAIVQMHIEFRDTNDDEKTCLSHLVYHMENGNVMFHRHNDYRCVLQIQGHMKNRILGYKSTCNNEGKQFDNDMNSALEKTMIELGLVVLLPESEISFVNSVIGFITCTLTQKMTKN